MVSSLKLIYTLLLKSHSLAHYSPTPNDGNNLSEQAPWGCPMRESEASRNLPRLRGSGQGESGSLVENETLPCLCPQEGTARECTSWWLPDYSSPESAAVPRQTPSPHDEGKWNHVRTGSSTVKKKEVWLEGYQTCPAENSKPRKKQKRPTL